jgi:hypothetical protein
MQGFKGQGKPVPRVSSDGGWYWQPKHSTDSSPSLSAKISKRDDNQASDKERLEFAEQIRAQENETILCKDQMIVSEDQTKPFYARTRRNHSMRGPFYESTVVDHNGPDDPIVGGHNGPGDLIEALPPSSLQVDDLDQEVCLEALLNWLNHDESPLMRSPLAQAARAVSFMSRVRDVGENINIIRCSEGGLSSVRNSQSTHTARVEVIAAWSVDDGAFSWRFENWLAELQSSARKEVSFLLCSAMLASSGNWTQQLAGENQTCKKHVLVCSFSPTQDKGEQHIESSIMQQYYGIACPPSVLPLRFASLLPRGGQTQWRLEHRQVLPLPG